MKKEQKQSAEEANSSTLPALPLRPEVDSDNEADALNFQMPPPAFSASVKASTQNVKYQPRKKHSRGWHKKSKVRNPGQSRARLPPAKSPENPYRLNVRPGKFKMPSYRKGGNMNSNAKKLQQLMLEKRRQQEAQQRNEDIREVENVAAKRGINLCQVDHLLGNDDNNDPLEQSDDSQYVPPSFASLEEAKIHYERKQLQRQHDHLLSPLGRKVQVH